MTIDEFELEFNMLANNINSNKAPGYTPLEISILLTEAQDLVIKDLYGGNNGFEKDEEVSEYLRTLITHKEYDSDTLEYETSVGRNKVYTIDKLPDDLMFITSEYASCSGGCQDIPRLIVTPAKQDEFSRIYKNPFRGPNKNRVIRTLSADRVYLYSIYDILTYVMNYIKNPEPIVLKGASSYGVEPYTRYPSGNNCKLPESLHRVILLKAVELAQSVWGNK